MLMLGQMRVRLMLIEVQNEREKDATDRQMQTGGLNCEIKKKPTENDETISIRVGDILIKIN